MLTRKQYELLMFIDESLRATGISPSFDEMKEALDLKSKSGIHRLITGLEERGFIRRLAHRARALEVIKLPENQGDQPLPAPSAKFSPNVIKGDFGQAGLAGAAKVAAGADAVSLPLYGKIAAGTPIEALRDLLGMVAGVVEAEAAEAPVAGNDVELLVVIEGDRAFGAALVGCGHGDSPKQTGRRGAAPCAGT